MKSHRVRPKVTSRSAIPLRLLSLLAALFCAATTRAADPPKEKPKPPEWTLDLAKMKIPDAPAAGQIHGQPFTLNYATLKGGVLTLGQDQGAGRPRRGLYVQMFYKQNEDPHNKTWKIPADQTRDLPLIQLLWEKPKDTRERDSEDIKSGYTMILEIGPAANGKSTGKIYICLPDQNKSVVAGTFEIVEK